MALVGTPGVYATVLKKTSEINKNLFVTASSSLGGSKVHIITKHIFPYVKGNLSVLFVKEIILVLGLIGQLGIFDTFLGGTIKRETPPYIHISETHEWAGIVGQWRGFIYGSQWILFFPLCAYIVLLLGFYLISRGLEQKQRKTFYKVPYL
ncbi:peptide/nickel transport system permease protein [Lentibacillus halodurans]|uniref:Peptide/nickel transport system permease protein n=2 Tax=Lentibacillus halodurans TaxID=237679 RepID=A0A1I0Y083_9BACI|nr:peptide/nickel transport system permease protein [Lentibacillus halodurans]